MNIKPKKSNHAVPKSVGKYEYGEKITLLNRKGEKVTMPIKQAIKEYRYMTYKHFLTAPKKPELRGSKEHRQKQMERYIQQLTDFRSRINYYRDIKEKYNLGYIGLKRMQELGLNNSDILAYYVRERDIVTGKYDEMRKQTFINNYVKYLKSANVSRYMINKFKQLVTPGTVDVIQELDLLPYIKLWGDTKGNTDIDTDEYDNLILNLKQALKTIKKTMAK